MTGITYEEALSTLSSMFGFPWTREHLDMILRHFKGHMENTVEVILSHGDADPDALVARLRSSKEQDVSNDEAIARQLALQDSASSQSIPKHSSAPRSAFHGSGFRAPSSPLAGKGIGTPTTLPPDFLRVPGRSYRDTHGDEALARMLQDDLFTEELANNPEFAHLARGRPGHFRPRVSTAPVPEGPSIADQLATLGNNAKKRLALLAAQWNARNRTSSLQNQEARGLLNSNADEREEDHDFFGFATQSPSTTEMEMSSMPSSAQNNKKYD